MSFQHIFLKSFTVSVYGPLYVTHCSSCQLSHDKHINSVLILSCEGERERERLSSSPLSYYYRNYPYLYFYVIISLSSQSSIFTITITGNQVEYKQNTHFISLFLDGKGRYVYTNKENDFCIETASKISIFLSISRESFIFLQFTIL